MYHSNSALQRQRITEWHQQGSSQAGKRRAGRLMAEAVRKIPLLFFFFFFFPLLLKLELDISFCVGLQFKCTSAVWNDTLNALYSRPCLFTGTNQRWFHFRSRGRWKVAAVGCVAKPWYKLWYFPQTECWILLRCHVERNTYYTRCLEHTSHYGPCFRAEHHRWPWPRVCSGDAFLQFWFPHECGLAVVS